MILGVGVEPGTPVAWLRDAMNDLAALADLSVTAVTVVATIDTRADEPAVRALADGRTLRSYPAALLDTVDVPHPSSVVRRLAGTGSVAEAAALLAARELGEGVLLVDKRRGRGVTVALAR